MTRPYYVIAGGYDTLNVGDYSMLKLLVEVLHAGGFDAKLLVRHKHEHLTSVYHVDALIRNLDHRTREESKGRFFVGLNHGDGEFRLQQIAQLLDGAEGLVIGGGRLLVDYCLGVGRGPLAYYVLLTTLCRALGVPTYVYAMSIVPVASTPGQDCLRLIIDCARRVAVRGDESLGLLNEYGCHQDNVSVIPDPAYALSPPSGLERMQRVAVTVRPISRRYCGLARADYLEQMTRVIRVAQSMGYEVVGVPHQYYEDGGTYDDRAILGQLPCHMVWEGEVRPDINDYLELYSGCQHVIGIRRHGMIFAALAGAHVVGMAENPNAARALAEVGGTPLSLRATEDEIAKAIDSKQGEISVNREGLRQRYAAWLFGEGV